MPISTHPGESVHSTENANAKILVSVPGGHEFVSSISLSPIERRRFFGGWTDECKAMLRDLWEGGYTATQISGEFGGGFTRNAILGMVYRLGLTRRSAPVGKIRNGLAR